MKKNKTKNEKKTKKTKGLYPFFCGVGVGVYTMF